MKIYFAGSDFPYADWWAHAPPRLLSYYYHTPGEVAMRHNRQNEQPKIDIFLDSGAFSAWVQKVPIDIDEYIEFIKQNQQHLTVYANLDVIGLGGKQPNRRTAEATLYNQKRMERADIQPIPTFHFGEPFEYLQYYVDNYSYLALGIAGNVTAVLVPWLDECFSKYICRADGMPKIKVHGFAVTAISLMFRYPWYSVDSTSWCITGRVGRISVPGWKGGKWRYNEATRVAVSNRSPAQRKAGEHYTTMSPQQQQIVLRYLQECGVTFGVSEFKMVEQTYELRENETWFDKKPQDSTALRKVEIVKEPGVTNKYQLRDHVNIQYYLGVQRAIPQWPWPFKPSTIKMNGFGL